MRLMHIPPCWERPWPVLTSRSSRASDSTGTRCQRPGTVWGLCCQLGTARVASSALPAPVPPGRPQEPGQGAELLLNAQWRGQVSFRNPRPLSGEGSAWLGFEASITTSPPSYSCNE